MIRLGMILPAWAATSPSSAPPSFADYPAPESFTGVPAKVDFASNPEMRSFRTRLREGAAQGPNFSGELTVVSWGCGTACQSSAIVSARTGKIVASIQTCNGVDFRKKLSESESRAVDEQLRRYPKDYPEPEASS